MPTDATTAHILPGLANSSLLSIGQLCDHGCQATFTADAVSITRHNDEVLRGNRNLHTGLWDIDLPPTIPPSHSPSAVHAMHNVSEHSTQRDLVTFLHAACFSPVPSTWIDAIHAGHFTTWPGLTADLVRKHLPKSPATIKGHLNQQRKNIRSTKDTSPIPTTPEPRSNIIFASTIEYTGQIYSDLAGRYPITSSRGNKYLLIIYDYDSNAILAEPLKNRSDNEMLRAYQKQLTLLQSRGLHPKLHKLDNEASHAIQKLLHSNGVTFLMVRPHVHRRNAAERAIQTFKNHLIAGLCSTDTSFPLHLWDRLVPQAELTLNLLRTSRINPKLSAHAQLHGAFDFNCTPLVPPGTKIIVHEKPQQRASWAPHGVDGWYLGPALHHYRCYRTYIIKTAAERIADTVEFFPEHIPMPKTSSTDRVVHAARELSDALQHPHPATPFNQIGDQQLHALQQLSKLFNTQATIFTTSTAATSPRVPASAPRVPASSPRVPAPYLRVPVSTNTKTDSSLQPTLHRYPTRSRFVAAAASLSSYSSPRLATVIDPITGASLEYRHLVKGPDQVLWEKSFSNELGRLAQGIGTCMKSDTDTIFFINHAAISKGRTSTYGRLVATIRPHKAEKYRVRLTVRGNRIDYPSDVSTPTAELTTAKLLFNSVLSTLVPAS